MKHLNVFRAGWWLRGNQFIFDDGSLKWLLSYFRIVPKITPTSRTGTWYILFLDRRGNESFPLNSNSALFEILFNSKYQIPSRDVRKLIVFWHHPSPADSPTYWKTSSISNKNQVHTTRLSNYVQIYSLTENY